MKDLKLIIDCEHHVIPRVVFEHTDYKFRSSFWQEMPYEGVENNKHIPLLFEPEKHIEIMEEAGVDFSIITSSAGWHASLDACKFLNEELVRIVEDHPNHFIAVGHVNPLEGDAALKEVQRAVRDLGLKGIGIPCFLGTGVNLDSPILADFYTILSEEKIPLFIHPPLLPSRYSMTPEYNYHPPMVREFDLAASVARLIYGGVIKDNPGLKVVFSHFGGTILMVKERLNMAAIRYGFEQNFEEYFAKLYFNMAGYNGEMSIVKFALEKIKPDKLLFATDFPYNFKKGAPEIEKYINNIRSLDLDQAQKEAILGGNAQELLKIED